MESLRGVIERITYHNEENGYTVAKLTPERGAAAGPRAAFSSGEVAIVGNMAGVAVGEFVELRGRWTMHAEYGKQFAVEEMRTVLPATLAGLEKYLGSGLIKGVGPVTAARIVRQFGLDTLEVIERTPERLAEVPTVGPKRVRQITAAWAEQRAIKEVMLFLQSHGVSTSLATKIYKNYGDAAIDLVRSDPYRLARDIYGIGFLTADKIARALGIPGAAPQRVMAGIAYTLNQATDEGHVYLPSQELVQQAAELLEAPADRVQLGLVRLRDEGQVMVARGGEAAPPNPLSPPPPMLVAEQGALYAAATVAEAQQMAAENRPVYLTPLYYSEQGAAGRLQRLAREGASRLGRFQTGRYDWERAFENVERGAALTLAPQQRSAVRAALIHRLTVLTGGPGTGKTTTVRTILQLCEREGQRVLLAAPTGRAAKRLAETTGREAKTLHRLLEFKPSEGVAFGRNEENPLECDLLIVDEASMLDLVLTHHLLKAVPPGAHLLLVGDVDQLPSVGAGNVLKDVIAAIEGQEGTAAALPSAAVVRLETIFRQAEGSYIITNAHRINQGQMPVVENERAVDFFLFRTEDPERAAQLCVELVTTRIPRRFAIPSQDIQVLTPMHRGAAGVAALNERLQAAVNPPALHKLERLVGSRVFRAGDRVMQVRNNYDKDVYNGDMGTIRHLDNEQQKAVVEFDGRGVGYDYLELDELMHAFAISVHKSQGSEFPAVVIPMLMGHYMLLQRNLLYTAVTRARRLVVLVGQPKALGMAVRNAKVAARSTGLRARLVGEM